MVTVNATTKDGRMTLTIHRLSSGQYRADSVYFDSEGREIPEKAHSRIVDSFSDLLITSQQY